MRNTHVLSATRDGWQDPEMEIGQAFARLHVELVDPVGPDGEYDDHVENTRRCV